MPKTDPPAETYHVWATAYALVLNGDGEPIVQKHGFDDWVPTSFLAEYVADAKTRWGDANVHVSDKPEHPPTGPGKVTHPEHLKLGKTLQQHLHDKGVKHIDDPTNTPNAFVSDEVKGF